MSECTTERLENIWSLRKNYLKFQNEKDRQENHHETNTDNGKGDEVSEKIPFPFRVVQLWFTTNFTNPFSSLLKKCFNYCNYLYAIGVNYLKLWSGFSQKFISLVSRPPSVS